MPLANDLGDILSVNLVGRYSFSEFVGHKTPVVVLEGIFGLILLSVTNLS